MQYAAIYKDTVQVSPDDWEVRSIVKLINEPNKPLQATVNGDYCRNICGCYKGDSTKKEYIKCNCDELEGNADATSNS